MADKNKKYLIQDDELGEEETKKVTQYDFNKSGDIEKFNQDLDRKKPDAEEITVGGDGAQIEEEENIEEVEQSRVMKFDVKNGGDVKALQQMLDKGVDSKKITVGTDGTIQVSENQEDVIGVRLPDNVHLTMEDFKRLVADKSKVNLSESEIMSILFESENPRMKKSDLIEEINNQIIYEADMHDDVRRKFDSGEHDYSGHLDSDTVRNISQQVFGDVQRNIREKTGRQNVNMDDVQMLLGNSLMAAIQKEQRIGTEVLEQRAIQMIRNQFNIPEDAVDFDAQITGLPQLGGTAIQKGNLQYTKGTKTPPQGKSEEELKPEITRRRLTNAMMHGAARKSQNLHHLSDELRNDDPTLNNDYSKIMAANDAMYWMMSDEAIENEGRGGVHAGNVRLDLSNPEKPKVIAQGIVFPILLHELAKGVMELMSLWSLPEDKDIRDYVTDKTDHLEAETNDIRLGSHIWAKFVEQVPVDNQDVISMTFNLLQQLPTDEFNSVMSGLSNDQEQARNTVRELAQSAIDELSRENYDDAIGTYGEEPQGEERPEDVDDVLGGGEVDTPMDEPQEDEYSDPSTWSQKEIQDQIDLALDAGDFETVANLSKYLR